MWIVDLGLAAKVRPCLILSDYPKDEELALIMVVPHTTAVRNNRWELTIPKRFLKEARSISSNFRRSRLSACSGKSETWPQRNSAQCAQGWSNSCISREIMKTQGPLFLSLNEGYNRWAKFYDADDNPLHLLEETVVNKALGDVRRKTVLDLGCGTGRQTLRLAAKGARVTGVDQSEGMLEKAKAKDTGGAVQFLHLNLDGAFPFADASYDLVVSFLALEHLADLGRFFSHCRRVCRESGFLYFTAMHPAMLLRGVQAALYRGFGPKSLPQGIPLPDFRLSQCRHRRRVAAGANHGAHGRPVSWQRIAARAEV